MPAAAAFSIDVGTVIIVLALLLFLYALYFTKQYAPSFPIIGNVYGDYIADPLSGWIRGLTHNLINIVLGFNASLAWDTWSFVVYTGGDLWGAIKALITSFVGISSNIISNDVVNFVNYAYGYDVTAYIGQVYGLATSEVTQINFIAAITNSLASRVTILESAVKSISLPTDLVHQSALDATNNILSGVASNVRTIQQDITGIQTSILPIIETGLTKAENDATSALNKVTTLTNEVGPLITQFPLLVQEIGGIVTDFPNIKTLAQQAIRGIEALSPLLAIAALSTEAIITLEDLANDPCMCFNPGGDMEWLKLLAIDQILIGNV